MKRRRKKERKQGDPPRWRKKKYTGSHTMRDGTVVEGDAVIQCWPEDLAGARDKFVALDPIETDGPPTPIATLTPVHIKEDEWDVQDQNGKSVTDRPLTAEEAQDLVNGTLPPPTEEELAQKEAGSVDVVREISKDMILTEKDLTKTGKPELSVLRDKVKKIDPDIKVDAKLRNEIFEELTEE